VDAETLKNMSPEDAKKIADLKNFLSFQWTWQFIKFIHMPFKVVALFTGNQAMKTSGICYQYVLRVMSWHPIPKKNILYFECEKRNNDNLAPHGFWGRREPNGVIVPGWEKGTWNLKQLGDLLAKDPEGKCPHCGSKIRIHKRKSRVFRMCSETLPGDKQGTSQDGTQTAETKNTVYPELKKWMPNFLIKRDITFRNPALIIADPNSGMKILGEDYIGDDIVFDFVSYQQSVQAGAGVQRVGIFVDEEPPKDFYDEQLPRLLAEDGDIIMGLTPANGLSWTYDDIFERAKVYYRTPKVVEFLNEDKTRHYDYVEVTTSPNSIGVLQAATDDNPVLSREVIAQLFDDISDPDTLATRRYGIHKQVSGRIFKEFDYRVHYVSFNKYFPDGMFHSWNHYRMVDYHQHNPWAVIWMSISPWNEAFIWSEYGPNPEKITTWMIANEMAHLSQDYKFSVNLIDPLAAVVQTNTGTSTIDDMNDAFLQLKKEGIGTGGYWESWDSKGTRGREVVRMRLKNAKEAGVPFNNKMIKNGANVYQPTLWICDTCREVARSMKHWRLEEWANRQDRTTRDRKEKPSEKHSHFCTALEAAFKDVRVKPAPLYPAMKGREAPRYFQGGRRHAAV
jgi:phage terminase large subunit-like protein/DNA-directed RNA polymerase subunit RPC12/RpoP